MAVNRVSAAKSPIDMASAMTVVLRVIKAELYHSVQHFGRMDPYAIVKWTQKSGVTSEVARTLTDWNADLRPQWNHSCRAEQYREGDELTLEVYEDDVFHDTLCGVAKTKLNDLMGNISPSAMADSRESASGPICNLDLLKNKKPTGKITVQVLLVPPQNLQKPASCDMLSHVPIDMFEIPARRLKVSGGTAPFFSLSLRNPQPGQSATFYLGKDLSRASDEVDFYERILASERQNAHGKGMNMLLDFCFEYAGIFRTAVDDEKEGDPPKDLLVLRNLRDGCSHLRMIDVKIGQKTAQAGWQGKSRLAALRQNVIDGITNSLAEGYRLEGFDGEPPTLLSMDPLLDIGTTMSKTVSAKASKKAFRIMMQRLSGAEIFMHLVDVHQVPQDIGDAALTEKLSPLELAEIALHEICIKMVRLQMACRHAPVPQKWIGSSVALGFDDGHLPDRQGGEKSIRRSVRVHIFDWGRSEFNTLAHNDSLSSQERYDRSKYWAYYVGGIDRLSWEACRAYWHRFGNVADWSKALVTVFDFDSNSPNDFIGRIEISPLRTISETTVPLLDVNGVQVKNFAGKTSTITYSVGCRQYPDGSRLKSSWIITVVRATNLIGKDVGKLSSTSDPFVEVFATAENGKHCFRQQTSIKPKTTDPEWKETLSLPVVVDKDALIDGLRSAQCNSVAEELAGRLDELLLPERELVKWKFNFSRDNTIPPEKIEAWEKCIDRGAEKLEDAREIRDDVKKLVKQTSMMLHEFRTERKKSEDALEQPPEEYKAVESPAANNTATQATSKIEAGPEFHSDLEAEKLKLLEMSDSGTGAGVVKPVLEPPTPRENECNFFPECKCQ